MNSQDAIDDAVSYVPPACLPVDVDGASAVICRLAQVWGVRAGLGLISLDDAYGLAKMAAETLQVSTGGAYGRHGTFRLLTHLVDIWSARIADHCAMVWGQAEHAMVRAGIAALSKGCGEHGLRTAIADVAQTFSPRPPIEVLHVAHHRAIADARRNTQWISHRAAAT